MASTSIKDHWVFSSADKVMGGGTLDAPPVRVVEQGDRNRLKEVIEELLAEPMCVVSQPDYNDRRFTVGIRAEAVGLKSWSAFAKEARCFNLERLADKLVLEEWPKRGGTFGGKAEWRKEFGLDELSQLLDFLIDLTKTVRKPRKLRRPTLPLPDAVDPEVTSVGVGASPQELNDCRTRQ